MTMFGVEGVKSGPILGFAMVELTAFVDDGLDVGYKRRDQALLQSVRRKKLVGRSFYELRWGILLWQEWMSKYEIPTRHTGGDLVLVGAEHI